MKVFLLIFFFLLSSCNSVDENDLILFEKAKKEYTDSLFDSSVISLNKLINIHPESIYAAESMYLLHKIYLNEYEEYDLSIAFLDNIIERFPENELAKKSLFTKGYVYSNHLSSYTDAYIAYNEFVSKYPNDELVPSAEYEIEGLKSFILDVENLLNKK